ncbi:MAG: hypothetical protein COB20_09435 [SAR86 cluster bacterium]|uniref:Gfo/Idh/MocA-like oxidoreductase N-terminal domain-containing protein n=1 Tax=SAR86 cluster bacterium TaxID=2030880 RepID=A0A2A4X4D6_9GAMM|nr:MAG: hypothetical protein COB20_09435 [SAR86 cluster bacterium]
MAGGGAGTFLCLDSGPLRWRRKLIVSRRLALVGVGKWGANFLKTIVASGQDEIRFIVSSKSRQQLDAIAANQAVLLTDISLIDSYVNEIDGVIVATPPAVRANIVEQLLRLGLPVLAEKPLSLQRDDSLKLIELARSSGVPLVEDFIHLFSWPYIKLNEQLSHDSPIEIESRGGNRGPYRDYSPLYDYSPHDLAMILQIFDCMPDSISLELQNIEGELAFGANIVLGFGQLGQAKIFNSNTSSAKERLFVLRQGEQCWEYDDTSDIKLTLNGISQSSSLSSSSSIQLALDYFCGRKEFYKQEKMLWLSKSVAEILYRLELQYAELIKNH